MKKIYEFIIKYNKRPNLKLSPKASKFIELALQEWYVKRMGVSSFFSSKLIESCTKLKHTSVVQDYAEFTNLTIFGPKVVQPEMN